MTLIGCVAGGAAATDPLMLSDASLASVAGTAAPGQVTTAMPAATPSSAAAPAMPTAAGAPAMPSASRAPATPTAQPPATAGTVGTTGTAGTVATASSAAPVAAPATSPVAPSGYRLSGADVSGFRGQRVQIVGSLVQPGSAAAPSATAPGATNTGMREFKVQSVQAISGSCPQR